MTMYIAIGALAGVISGMGIGGGSVLIPALVIFMDMPQKAAQNINLIYFIPTALIALAVHAKNKSIEKSYALKLMLPGVLTAALASVTALWLDANVLRKAFGVFMLILALYEMLSGKGDKSDAA
ncbi:MAG: sulfite exporter TauE/SafE family protein [Clostridiales bacterium]|nr:sulfite exporter TauE/SafE family protein [Clostridiales bacterium]